MSNKPKNKTNRSVHIGGNASQNVIQTGDYNAASMILKQITLPPPATVDIHAEMEALREALAKLDSSDCRKIENAISDAEDELNKAEPNKDEIGKALGRALEYAQKAEGFAKAVENLKPHVTKAIAWLGENWHKLLGIVGLTV